MTLYVDVARLKAVWTQTTIPVVMRLGIGRPLSVRLPFAEGNGEWLKMGRRRDPKWNSNDRFWELPKAWLNTIVDRSLDRYGSVYVIQPYQEQEKCSPACMNAQGHECQCSCMGANHGAGNDGSWFEVSDAFACRWNEYTIACRLMKRLRALPGEA
ncbi:hypothetical protein J2Z31_004627 [Sinorhizobium kostiense]|uniref:Uncharacterized protein n=1 Tax=Sinorhizobium kostiense TaxID=76747 RepID=A0ABS4R5E3_9HYPH|nr:hypothetical protein [Sinorhizobium kostiense]